MPRWLLWSPVLALTAAIALLGLRSGLQVSQFSESDAITAAAQRYLAAGQGRRASDCAARPSDQPGVWLLVTCVPQQGRPARFHIDSLGSVRVARPQSIAPET